MSKTFLFLIISISIIVGGVYYFFGKNIGKDNTYVNKVKINVSSSEFTNGGVIPNRFTCNGDDVNPPLIFDRIPGDAKSLVLIIDDPDAGTIAFNHWLVFNIDPSTTNIEESKIPDALEGTNDFGELKYMGPCPTGTHTYHFRVYALDTMLSLNEGAKRPDIDSAIKGHILGQGDLTGVYSH